MSEPRIRRQCYELTAEDLSQYPIWEFALDEEGEDDQDEATVRPIPFNYIPANEWRMMVVAAEARFAGGKVFPATLYLNASPNGVENDTSKDALASYQPCVLVDGKLLSFWYGMLPSRHLEEGMAKFYAHVGLPAEQVFPIEVTAAILVEGENAPRQIRVTGFQRWDAAKQIVEDR